MDLFLKDKVFIVSGGAEGIGEAITRSLVQEKAKAVIADRSKEADSHLQNEIISAGGECLCIPIELSDTDNCKFVIKQTVDKFGQIDGIINNAGVNDGAGLEKGSPELFRKSISTNLFHYYDLVHYALPYLKKSHGSIINISSKTALTGQGGTSGYAASKGAQLSLTREWAVELSEYGIRVNAIIPAEVNTPQYTRWLKKFKDPEHKLASIQSRIPFGKRMTTSQEIASMVVFLLSDRSAHTTGQWIVVDGGYIHLDRSIT